MTPMNRRFQSKILLFFVTLFAVVQLLTVIAVNTATKTNFLAQARTQLDRATAVFNRAFTERGSEFADAARITASDFGFRSAIAAGDKRTIVSSLMNIAGRIDADRIMLVSLDKEILADTGAAGLAGRPFAYSGMLAEAEETGRSLRFVEMDGKILQFVVLPVLAPIPIAWIAVASEVDQAVATELTGLFSVKLDLSFIHRREGEAWRVVVTTLKDGDAAQLPDGKAAGAEGFGDQATAQGGSNDFLSRLVPLPSPPGETIAVALHYDMAAALAPYRSLVTWLIVLSLTGLIFVILGSMFIAHGVTRPIRQLSEAARQLRRGDYSQKVPVDRNDEFGQVSKSFNQMIDAIEARQREANLQRKRAEMASDAKSRFIANMSHEFRTPLNAILAYSELIATEAVGKLSGPLKKYKEFGASIWEGGIRLCEEVTQVIEFSDITGGDVKLREEVIELTECISVLSSTYQPKLDDRNIKLEVSLPASLPKLMADREIIIKMIGHLLSNAIKFSGKGSVCTIEGRLTEQNQIEVCVQDHGDGMDKDFLEHAFEPFAQRQDVYARNHQGTGLGLGFVKAYADIHGARISVDSRIGEGTHFAIRFPAVRTVNETAGSEMVA